MRGSGFRGSKVTLNPEPVNGYLLVLLDITDETELLLYHHFASPLCITTDFVMLD